MKRSPLRSRRTALSIAFILALGAAARGAEGGRVVTKEDKAMALTISTTAFAAGGAIPVRHTCDGEDVSPDLKWADPPAGTKAFALIVDDPDAPVGTWVHWVAYDLPADTRSLPQGVPKDETLKQPTGAKQGRNDFGRIGWGGPCPPPGKPHRYFFRLYALDAPLDLPAGVERREVDRAIQGHVLAKAEMYGTYARKR